MINPRLSILTATFNAGKHLPGLIESLKNQTDQDFEWIVADGGSTDDTLSVIERLCKDMKYLSVDSRSDYGIYDALNRAIKKSTGDYYLVAGADDQFEPKAVENFKKGISCSDAELVSARIKVNGKVKRERKPSWLWLYGASAKVSSHAVGTAIRTKLHSEFGFYSKKYQIYADGHFMLRVIKSGAKVELMDFVSGSYSTEGVSNRNQMISFSEQFRSQIENGSSWFLQLIVFSLRISKWGFKGALK